MAISLCPSIVGINASCHVTVTFCTMDGVGLEANLNMHYEQMYHDVQGSKIKSGKKKPELKKSDFSFMKFIISVTEWAVLN